jgi:phosphate transport system permease protein
VTIREVSGSGIDVRRHQSRFGEKALTTWLGFSGIAVATLIGVILIFLAIYSWPAIRFNGWGFLSSQVWTIGNLYGGHAEVRNGYTGSPGASFGILVFIVGTVLSSAVALLVATPLAILVAVALVFRIPPFLVPISSALLELMAGIPSVVYGLWGIVVLVPLIGNTISPWIIAHTGNLPIIGGEGGSGYGLLASGFILALMIVPIMSATIRDVILQVPGELIEASIALGSTFWQAVARVVIPAARTGIVAAFILAAGRALGETMAVLMVCGSASNVLPGNLYAPINTIAATIVSQLDSALTDSTGMAQRSIGELALVLFAITLIVNLFARTIMRGADRAGAKRRV